MGEVDLDTIQEKIRSDLAFTAEEMLWLDGVVGRSRTTPEPALDPTSDPAPVNIWLMVDYHEQDGTPVYTYWADRRQYDTDVLYARVDAKPRSKYSTEEWEHIIGAYRKTANDLGEMIQTLRAENGRLEERLVTVEREFQDYVTDRVRSDIDDEPLEGLEVGGRGINGR